MAKVRVHELAKELGITSKEALSTLKDLGEFVSSASSTIEPPVVKKLRNAYPGAGKSAAKPGSTPAAPAAGRPAAPKPAIIIAQVAGSGTAATAARKDATISSMTTTTPQPTSGPSASAAVPAAPSAASAAAKITWQRSARQAWPTI